MVFSVVVGFIGGAGFPIDFELLLFASITDPVVSHVDCFGFTLSHSVVGEPVCAGVIGDEWGWWLGVSHFL